MRSELQLTLCITAFNESHNIGGLFNDLDQVHGYYPNLKVIIRDNCSTDDSEQLSQQYAQDRNWVTVLSGSTNVGYGGGFRLAALEASTNYVVLYPADRQYPPTALRDTIRCWLDSQCDVVLGKRIDREDGAIGQLQSRTYSKVCQLLLGIGVSDVNALPKIVPRSLLTIEDFPYSTSFFLDAQLLSLAKSKGMEISACEVRFLRRSAGISSWGHKKIRTIASVIREAIAFRKLIRCNFHENVV